MPFLWYHVTARYHFRADGFPSQEAKIVCYVEKLELVELVILDHL